MIKVIFCDMDGTLLDEKGNLPPQFEEIMDMVLARGAIFVPASGRQYSALTYQLPKYVDKFIFIAENGTFAARKDEELFSTTLKPELVVEALTRCESVPETYPVLCGKRVAYVDKRWEPYLGEMTKYFTQYELVEDLMVPAREAEIIKVAVCDYQHAQAETRVYPALQSLAEGGELQVVLSSNYWIDMMATGVSKGVAARRIQQLLGVKPEECAAFGDYLNDFELLQAVKYSYAMENAHHELKEVARGEAPSNEHYGVMQVLRKLLTERKIGYSKFS